MGGMAAACKNGIRQPFWSIGGMEVVMVLSVRPFCRMGGLAVACNNGKSPSILADRWHGGSDVMIESSILAYEVTWRSRARIV
jgi:hypothetical protein